MRFLVTILLWFFLMAWHTAAATPSPMIACKPTPVFSSTSLPFSPAIVRPTDAEHCFSVCLYREPEFVKRFPNRDYKKRYLDTIPAIREFTARHNFALNIFADPAMLETALSFDVGSVYVVTAPPAFPFSQHVYRYYSALLPTHPTIRAYHFRGLDNVTVADEELALLRHFVDTGAELMHAPYLRAAGSLYTPVRGTCSIAGQAIRSLGEYLISTPNVAPEDHKGIWHNDEIYLGRWFDRVKESLFLYTIIDREMPIEYHMQFAAQIRQQRPFHIASLSRSTFTHPSK